jgi:hypothetical protein
MIPSNNYDKLILKKILDALKIFQEACCTENIENTNNTQKLILTLPIIIAEKNITIPIESTFKLKNPALDIKSTKKDVYLTNSTLLPMYDEHNAYSSTNGKLFLEGFIRNKLDFSIAKVTHDNVIYLDTESVIIYIPFKSTTVIRYKTPPVFVSEKTPDYIPIYISSDSVNINKGYKNKEYINCNVPPITCELKGYKLYETHSLLDKTPFNEDFPIEINFNTLKQNIVINLSLILLQEQDIAMNCNNTPK